MRISLKDVSNPDGDVGPVPRSTAATDLDFGACERRRRPHNGGTDVAPDVDDDRARFARSDEVMGVHGGRYGATDTGVADGFEKPL